MDRIYGLYREYGNPFGRVPEEMYKLLRKRKSGFRHYERKHDFFRQQIKKELNSLMNFSEDYEFWMYTKRFERDFSRYMGSRHAVGASSGTSALTIALRAIGVGEGSEVITTPNSYIATALAISNTGARPVFVDIEMESYNMDPALLENAITERTKAVMPVHMYGNPARMREVLKISKRNNLKVVEDACHSHGAEYRGKKTGTIGDIGCFSFFTNKNLGGMGNGGMSITDSKRISKEIRLLSNPESGHPDPRSSTRTPSYLDAVQVAFLRPGLSKLDKMNMLRRRNAVIYNESLEDSNLVLPSENKNGKHVYFSFVVRSKMRDRLRKHLSRRGVETRIEYPIPLHLETAFRHLGYRKGDFPVTENLSGEILSLPLSPLMGQREISDIVKKVILFAK